MPESGPAHRAIAVPAVSLLLLIIFSSSPAGAAGDAGRLSRLVPADVSNFIQIEDFHHLAAGMRKSPYGAMAQEDDMADFMEAVVHRIGRLTNRLETEAGLTAGNMLDALRGGMAIAFRREHGGGSAGSASNVLYLMETAAEGSGEVENMLAALQEHASGCSDIAGRRVYTIKRQLPSAGNEPDGALMFSYDGAMLAILDARSPDLLERHFELADRKGGAVLSLAELPLFSRLRKQVPPAADYLGFKNFTLFWEELREHSSVFPPPGDHINMEGLFGELGIFALEGSITAFRLHNDGVLLDGSVRIKDTEKGIWKAFSPPHTPDVRPLPFVEADAALYTGAYCSLPALWEEVRRALRLHAPGIYEKLTAPFSLPEGPLDLQEDIIGTLGDRMFIYLPADAGSEARGRPGWRSGAIAADLREPERLKDAVESILKAAFPGYTYTRLDGHAIFTVPAAAGEGSDRSPARLTLCFLDKRLIVTADPSRVPALIAGKGRRESPLTARKDFRKSLNRLVPSPSSFSYIDLSIIGGMLYDILMPFIQESAVPLPEYETLKNYMSELFITAKWDEGGVNYRVWIPYPDTGDAM